MPLRSNPELINNPSAPPLAVPVCCDPNDDRVLAAAQAANADSIITGDQDLLTLGDFQGIPIRTALQALAILDRPG
jgi:predicted nucleic acid-binding protein